MYFCESGVDRERLFMQKPGNENHKDDRFIYQSYSNFWIHVGMGWNERHRPHGSGNYIEESALCALLDSNIYPEVMYRIYSFDFTIYCPWYSQQYTKILQIL